MRKPGTDEDNVQMSDVICDFCHSEWHEDEPMIEGHHGSCICGKCMTVAYTDVLIAKANTGPDGYKCTMCLEQRDDPAWQSPMYDEAVICRRCIKLGAGALHKSKEFDWSKPPGAHDSTP
jgi:hypothetical protein